ncbi:hypothetical protein TNCV_3717121 [Trichonephila clavipes]|nr:hypothetical protein TNCV_3717121 [Trichonephila clavipes]
MASSVSRSDSNRLMAVGILKFPGVLAPSIQSVGIGRYDPPRCDKYTGGHSALCRCWTCDTFGMCHLLWWWMCGAHTAAINDSVTLFLLFANLFFHLFPKRHLSVVL